MTLAIAVLGGKGGITKSTLARALAVSFQTAGWEALGLDSDIDSPTFSNWQRRRLKNKIEPTINVQSASTPAQISKIKNSNNWDILIIDGAAFASKTTVDISNIVDLVVMPTRYSMDDLESTVNTANALVSKGIKINKICFAFSGVAENESDHAEAMEYLGQTPFFVISGYIPHKPALSKAQDKGQSIIECTYVGPKLKADAVIQNIINRFEEIRDKE